MREESVCRLCFNLLNDIDYHLKVWLLTFVSNIFYTET